jgi:excisionase family DNA binding protein
MALVPTPDSVVLVRVEEAARRISVSRSKMFEYLAAGVIASVYIGERMRRVPASELERVALEGLPEIRKASSRRRQA